jgi:hypothetical protein
MIEPPGNRWSAAECLVGGGASRLVWSTPFVTHQPMVQRPVAFLPALTDSPSSCRIVEVIFRPKTSVRGCLATEACGGGVSWPDVPCPMVTR